MNAMADKPIISVDQLVINRAKVLILGALSFALWQFGWIAVDMIAEPQLVLYGVGVITSTLGAIGWVVTTVLLLKLNGQIKHSNAWSAMHDELVMKNRSTAFFQSYFILFAFIWLLIPLMDYLTFDAKYVVRAVATLGVVMPMMLFARFELQNDDGEE